jgi:hypothetical protein
MVCDMLSQQSPIVIHRGLSPSLETLATQLATQHIKTRGARPAFSFLIW